MAAATFDLRPVVAKKEWPIQGQLDAGMKQGTFMKPDMKLWMHANRSSLHFLGLVGERKPCEEDWVDLSSPGNTSSDAPTLSLSHQQVLCLPYFHLIKKHFINIFETPGNLYPLTF